MSGFQEQYHEVLADVHAYGTKRGDRTGTGTVSLFGLHMKFDMAGGFPLLTTRRLSFKVVSREVLWYLRGEDHVGYLREQGLTFWDAWAGEGGHVGPVYGVQWRRWPGPDGSAHDQLAEAVRLLREQPTSRRILVSAWNVPALGEMALPPCPFAFQLYAANGKVSMQVHQRSADLFVGLPHDVAGHALLLCMLAKLAGMAPGELSFALGDAHLYLTHLDACRELLGREPRKLPQLRVRDGGQTTPDCFKPEDFDLRGYDPWPPIRVGVAV